MFTGIIEETGYIKGITRFGNGLRIIFSGNIIFDDLKIDDSVAINGVCQTIIAINANSAVVEAVEETIKLTTFSNLKVNQKVNLERALLPTTRMGGHIVQGHIDTVGTIIGINKLSSSIIYKIEYPNHFSNLLVEKGSICVDGVSLTLSKVEDNKFELSIIPHTLKNTIIDTYKLGQNVNLEFDILGKYILKNMRSMNYTKSTMKNLPESILNKYIDQPEY